MPITAVVTGSSGFVGQELCKQLLARGFAVRGCVRNASNSRSKELLSALKASAPEGSVTLVEADLLSPGSFDSALEGADYVFHVASPFAIDVKDPQKDVSSGSVHASMHRSNRLLIALMYTLHPVDRSCRAGYEECNPFRRQAQGHR